MPVQIAIFAPKQTCEFPHMIKTDICIAGAGPGGVATALKLSQLGIPCVLIDKATFPRDKVCGDAISGKAATILGRINPAIVRRFEAATDLRSEIWGIRFVSPNNLQIDVPFRIGYDRAKDPKQGFVCKRLDFDNFLIEEVKRCNNITFIEDTIIDITEQNEQGFKISNADGSF